MKIPRVRAVALAVSMGLLGSLALAGPSLAAAPAAGIACQAADGKIAARGATFQTAAQTALANGYRFDVCGPTPGTPADAAGTNMVAYNYSGAPNGSGNGQIAASCRTDAFSGTDIPYDQNTLNLLNGVGALGEAPGSDIPGNTPATGQCANLSTFHPPFTPTSGAWPDPGDRGANVMAFPVAGSAVALGVKLGTVTCPTGTVPTSVRLSSLTVSKIFSGTITNWNDTAIVTDNPGWNVGCTGAITRVVRNSKSGTTQTFKNFLKNADGARALCDSNTWTILAQDANNTLWPAGGACPAITTASGGSGVATTTAATDGAIGYADYPDWFNKAVKLASVGNSGSTFVSPGSGAAGSSANCVSAFTAASLPGTSAADSVSLSPTGDNWATDAPTLRSDLTYPATGYPICGLTYDFVYTGLSDTAGTQTNAIWRLTNNQRRTLYSYFTYVLSPAAQFRLTTAGYDQLPTSWLTKLRQGFQGNF